MPAAPTVSPSIPTTIPTLALSLPPKLGKHISRFAFSVRETLSPGIYARRRFIPAKSGGLGAKPMSEVGGARVHGGGSSNPSLGAAAFEKESFVGDSSVPRPANRASGATVERVMNRLSKWFVAALFGAVILVRHDAKSLWAGAGSILNVVLSVTLKQMLNQERPLSASSSGPGMPSSHAQSIFFAVFFVLLSMVEWLGFNRLTTILGGLVLATGLYLSWLRVSLQYHTVSQVVVGAAVGFIFSALWFWMWNAIILKAFSHLWIKIVVVLGSTCLCAGFPLHVIRHWITDED